MQVLLTAIGIPPVREDAIARPRLLAALREGLSRKVLLITAEAGYGKTTLAAQFAGSLVGQAAWYSITESGRDSATFLASLLTAVEQARPGTTFLASQILASSADPARAWRPVADALINGLVGVGPDPLLVVLDDAHLIADSPAAPIPDYLAAHLPARAPLALISRTRPTTPEIARLAGQDQVLLLDSRALAFTRDEVAALLAPANGVAFPAEDVTLALARTEGWPLAVHLLAGTIRDQGERAILPAVEAFGRSRRELFDFFMTQVLDRLDPQRRLFVMQISVLDVLEPDVCAAVTGNQQARAELAELAEQGIFLTALDVGGDRYRLHSLFRDTLRVHLGRVVSGEEVRRLQRQAGVALAGMGRTAEAIPYFLSAEDYDTVAEHLAREGERWIQQGMGNRMAGWIAALPRPTLEHAPVLLTLLGFHLADGRGEYAEARRLFAAAAGQSTGEAAALARYGEASVLFRLGRLAEGREVCVEALGAEGLSPRARARLLRRLATCELGLMQNPQHVAARFGEALQGFQEAGDGYGEVQTLHELVFLYDLTQPDAGGPAGFISRLTALHGRAEHLAMRTDAAQAIGQAHIDTGDPERALAFLEEAGQGAALLDDAYRLSLFHMYRGQALSLMGRHREAEEVLRQGMTTAETRQVGQLVPAMRSVLALAMWREGRTADAAEVLHDVLALLHRYNVRLFVPSVLVSLGMISADLGRAEDAATHFAEAGRRYRGWGAERRAAECALYLVAVDSDGHREERRAALADAMAKAREHDLRDPFREHLELLKPVLVQALIDGVESEWVGQIVAHLGDVDLAIPALTDSDTAVRLRGVDVLAGIGGEESRHLLTGAVKDADPSVRARAREALELLSRRPPSPLSVRLLGGFEVRRGNRTLSPTTWRRKRDRLLFAYLVLSRTPVSRDTLLEALWPDVPPRTVGASLNAAWSHLKRALEPGLPEGMPSAYLVLERGVYGLRRDPLSTDVEEFEAALALADGAATPEEQVAHLEAAVALHRGDLLPEDANEPWTVVERERLRAAYLSALERLAGGWEQQGRLEGAAETLRVALRLEPWREEAYRRLMRILSALCRRSEALHLYRQCETLLQRELGVAPAPETTALFAAIAAGRGL